MKVRTPKRPTFKLGTPPPRRSTKAKSMTIESPTTSAGSHHWYKERDKAIMEALEAYSGPGLSYSFDGNIVPSLDQVFTIIHKLKSSAAEAERLKALLNIPEVMDFMKAVPLEAAHQRERWGSKHDEGKSDADWIWLIGYLASKALHNPGPHTERPEMDAKLHRIITIAAAAANWHAAVLGKTDMRPGIAKPKGE